MKPVLSRAQIRAFDRMAIDACHVPSIVLMENAGRGAADEIERAVRAHYATSPAFAPQTHGSPCIVVVAGPGNNGGDGFVVARHLLMRGFAVEVITIVPRTRFSGDARLQYEAFLGVGGSIMQWVEPAERIETDSQTEAAEPSERRAMEASSGPIGQEPVTPLEPVLDRADVIVDAILGTGLDRPVSAQFARAIDAINRRRNQGLPSESAPERGLEPAARTSAARDNGWARRPLVVALDIPSGLDADAGVPLGTAVHADLTVTFAHYKLGLFSSEAARLAGAVRVAEIGVPSTLQERIGMAAALVDSGWVGSLFLPRPVDVHKHAAGNVLVLAGAPGKVGAAVLVGSAALRAGAGLVTIATWPEAAAAIESRAVELMTARLDPARLMDSLDNALVGRRAVAIGPGFGLDPTARTAVEHVLDVFPGPVVVDADALTAFAGRADAFARARGRVVLTPHPGEAARLLGCRSQEVERDRFGAARELAARSRAVVVLKGAHTIVADGASPRANASPPGAPGAAGPHPAPPPASEQRGVEQQGREQWVPELRIDPAANPVLATAGSGDVLSGITAAFLTLMPAFDAASAAVRVHALAGERWRARVGADRGLVASEIAHEVPGVLAALLPRGLLPV